MDLSCPQINLLAAWLWIVLGFVSGLALGLFFHREDWLGGYGSFKRRLYRLAHISLFGLGVVNLCFYLTAKTLPTTTALLVASCAMVLGAISMPCCCLIMAHLPKARLLFSIPIVCLLLGGLITLVLVARPVWPGHADARSAQSAGPIDPGTFLETKTTPIHQP